MDKNKSRRPKRDAQELCASIPSASPPRRRSRRRDTGHPSATPDRHFQQLGTQATANTLVLGLPASLRAGDLEDADLEAQQPRTQTQTQAKPSLALPTQLIDAHLDASFESEGGVKVGGDTYDFEHDEEEVDEALRRNEAAAARALAGEAPGRGIERGGDGGVLNPESSRSPYRRLAEMVAAASGRGVDGGPASVNPRRDPPAAAESRGDPKRFFSPVVAYFAPEVSKTRRGILGDRITERGGAVARDVNDPRVTHVLTTSTTYRHWNPAARLVSPDWAQACIRAGELRPEDEHPPALTGGVNPPASLSSSPLPPVASPMRLGPPPSAPQDTSSGHVVLDSGSGADGLARPWLGKKRDSFACQQPSTAAPVNLNPHITRPLEELAAIYEDVLGVTNAYKARHHKQVAGAVERLDFVVTDVEQLCDPPVTPAFAQKTSTVRDKIRELLATGKLAKLEELKRKPDVKAILELSGVWGIGTETARKLHREDRVSTVAQLRALAERQPGKLSANQHVGLRFYEEFKERIPRDEVEALAGHVEDAVAAVCPGCSVTVAGSYRRGKTSCGDIDVLLCPSEEFIRGGSQGAPGATVDTVENILPAVLARLRTRGVVTDDLSTGTVSWMGVARLPDSRELTAPTTTDGAEGDGALAVVTPKRLHRRMDIKTYTPDEMPFALLYFTGSGYFNRSMRAWADKAKGLSLHDRGFNLVRGNDMTAVRDATFRDEKDVFEYLGLEYVPPEDRSV
mmetsp:Transcript_9128/g.36812  ORF Transcript_9128/g.36812 Transcript_9128/m.36812 type:complete len:741 (-) Transcript_9128:42-2264(-)